MTESEHDNPQQIPLPLPDASSLKSLCFAVQCSMVLPFLSCSMNISRENPFWPEGIFQGEGLAIRYASVSHAWYCS